MFRVDALDVPPPDCSDADILRCSDGNLFLLRANSLLRTVAADSAELRLVGDICRRQDGMPLAIELAAARAVALGVEGVYRRRGDRIAILAGGYRTALTRHQTLRATFDWSFALLDPGTQGVFRRLALSSGKFCFEAMCGAVGGAQHSTAVAIGALTDLVAKSIVSVEFEGAVAKYRLSESARAYALEKLVAEGELREIVGCNARYLSRCLQVHACDEMENAKGEPSNPTDFQQTLDDARLAIDWALSADGDMRAGIELISSMTGPLLDAGLLEECRARAVQALDAPDKLPVGTVDADCENRLRVALAAASPGVREQPAQAAAKPTRKRASGQRESHAPTVSQMATPAYFIAT